MAVTHQEVGHAAPRPGKSRYLSGAALGALAIGLVTGTALSPRTAQAQAQEQSPELPAKPTTEAQPETPQLQKYYKGKGPGRGNSYVERYEEDYSYLLDPKRSTDFFDPLKFIPLDPSGDIYLTLNGEFRFRTDITDHRNFNVATGATFPKTGPYKLTANSRTSENELYKERFELGGDLHLGPNFRIYTELYSAQQTGHVVGPSIPGNQRSDLALENGFGEYYGYVGDTLKYGARFGRQEIFFGNNLQIRANVSTNIPSPVFDGFRGYLDSGNARIDAFAYNVVNFTGGVLEDRDNPHTNLWGLYGSYDLPYSKLIDTDFKTTVEPFYLGYRARPFASGGGSGIYNDQPFLTGATLVSATGAGFISSQDHRNTFGVRYYGDVGAVNFDWQGAVQGGSYAGYSVNAFAFNTDSGYNFRDVPLRPRFSVHIDGASGGASKANKTLSTYQPMYPNTQYYLPNNEISPTNFYDISPHLTLQVINDVTFEAYYAYLWRYSQNDAVYIGAPWPGGNGANNFAVTTLNKGKTIGQQVDLRLSWAITPHVLTLFEFGSFNPGTALRAAQAKVTDYFDANLTLRF